MLRMRKSARLILLLLLLVTICISPGAAQEVSVQTLRIAGDSWDSRINPAFSEQYPSIYPEYVYIEKYDPISILTLIMQPGSSVDLYNFANSRGILEAVHRKGYCTYFALTPETQSATEAWPDFVRNLVMDDEGLFAVPSSITSSWVFGYNAEVGQAMGIAPPTSLEEIMEIYAEWPDRYLDQAEELGYYLSDFFVGESMSFSYFLERGIDYYLASSQPPYTFQTPRFHAFLDKLIALKPKLDALSDDYSSLMQEDAHGKALIEWHSPLLRHYPEDEPAYETLALSLLRGETPSVPVDVSALVVPLTVENPENGLLYARTLLEQPPANLRILLSPDTAQPVENDRLESIFASLEKLIAEQEQLLAAAETIEERDACQNELTKLRLEYDQFENGDDHWEYTPRNVANYLHLSAYLCPMPSVSYTYYQMQPNLRSLFKRFILGDLPVDNFIEQFDRLQQMMNEENQ